MYNYDTYNVFLAIATNTVYLWIKTGFVVKGHILGSCVTEIWSNDAENSALSTQE